MADKIPVKAILTAGNTSALGEFNPGDTLGVTFGGTGADNAASARTNLGLGNVDNTSDLDKPVSTAQAAADTAVLNAAASDATTKANAAEADAIAASTPIAHISDFNNPHSVTKAQVGLENVDNTSDLNKPISTATQTALNAKEPTITAGTTAKFWRGDKAWTDFATTVRASILTGLSLATGTVIAATDSVLVALGKLQKQITDNLSTLTTHTGNVSNPHSVTKTQVGLGSVDNTSDASKPISTATQTALDLKANLISPTFTTPSLGVATGTSFNSITGLSSTAPVMDGVAAVGTETTTARGDHVHPTDTSRAPIASPSFTGTLTHSGDVVLSGSGKRITGDFSNATIANRLMFQTSTPNANTFIHAVPSRDGMAGGFIAHNVTPLGAGSTLDMIAGAAGGTTVAIRSSIGNGGIYLPMTFHTGGAERMRIDTSGNVLVTSPAGLGYGPGAGGTVTQATSKSTTVTLNKPCGTITMHAASLAAGARVEFFFRNNLIVDTDVVVVNPVAGTYAGFASTYQVNAVPFNNGAYICVQNTSGVSYSEAFKINFAVIKGATY